MPHSLLIKYYVREKIFSVKSAIFFCNFRDIGRSIRFTCPGEADIQYATLCSDDGTWTYSPRCKGNYYLYYLPIG